MSVVLTNKAVHNVEKHVRQTVRAVVTRGGKNSEANAAFFSREEQSIWPVDSVVSRAAEMIRSKSGGYCPADKLEGELVRRCKIAMRRVAGPAGSADAQRLSYDEIASISDAWIRINAGYAAENARVPQTPPSDDPDGWMGL